MRKTALLILIFYPVLLVGQTEKLTINDLLNVGGISLAAAVN
jgi:hypothetical protein